ncbi:sigma-70 family RNA polymerase sigma factor [Motiliproteus sp. SC1-56]|uniref:sigma-70 family RNA polymerase sigma factor n=1 Tax=Motiliproteus sp. SC1-56 TaxID=2799565 RepID=UPI001F5DBC22|nr:sigma-70 family RNA polymerase sigma factor [Motiliproteus sp. SC1-56]
MSPQANNERVGDAHWAELMARIADNRDKNAFSRVYDHFAPRVKSYLLGQGAQEALADELLQAALLQVWEKAGQFNARVGSLSTWIYRIARNRYFDHLRRERVRDRPPPDAWLQQEDEFEREVHGGTQTEVERERLSVENALKQLPSRQAQVLYMSFYQGKTHVEIAGEMDIPLGSVKSSLRLAFEKLRCSLGAHL